MEVEFEPAAIVNGKRLTRREVDALLAVQARRSQNAAARELGLSVPVLHNYIKRAEEKAGERLVLSTPTYTVLTGAGAELVRQHAKARRKLATSGGDAVACTPLMAEKVVEAVEGMEASGQRMHVFTGDDQGNARLLDVGAVGLVFFDDPGYAYTHQGSGEIFEAGKDVLLHADNGPEYLEFKYGAQRLGYKWLADSGARYDVVGRTANIEELLASGKSFFVNKSLVGGGKAKGLREIGELRHSLLALAVVKNEMINELLERVGGG